MHPGVQEHASNEPHTAPLLSVFGGQRLHPTVWKPAGDAKAMIYVCHGVGEYMGRYDKLSSHLTENGLLVIGHDYVGHGRSEGDRVHIEDVNVYVQDVIRHIELMKSSYPHLPCILMGHSMGGLVAAHVAIQRSNLFTSLILSGAAAEFDAKFSIWVVMKAFELLSRIAPHLGVRTIDVNDISSIPEEVESYMSDPLIWHGALKARWGIALVKSITLLRENIGLISMPLLLIHGSDDNLVPITSSHFINENVSSQEKRFEVFEGSRHETLHDKEQERARELIKDWILGHLSASPIPHDMSDNPSETEECLQAGPQSFPKDQEQPEPPQTKPQSAAEAQDTMRNVVRDMEDTESHTTADQLVNTNT